MDALSKITLIPYINIGNSGVAQVIAEKFSRVYKFIHIGEEWNDANYYGDIEDENVITFLMEYADKFTRLHHIMYEGLPYYERSNTWGDTRPNDSDISHDEDEECSGYSSCETESEIYPDNVEDVEYIYEKHDEDMRCVRLKAILNEYSEDEVIICGYNNISFENTSGINDDHRGSTHCKVDLAYEDLIEFDSYISLKTLIEVYYRIKSHKFDKWYELYSSTGLDYDDYTANVSVKFDHGS